MADFKHILFPVDFSHQCVLQHSMLPPSRATSMPRSNLLHVAGFAHGTVRWEPETELLTKRLGEFADQNFEMLRVTKVVNTGRDPSQQIVRYARANRIDLIMLPTHGRGPFRRFVLGSVTTKVLHDTHCPVWTSAHLELERTAGASRSPKRTLRGRSRMRRGNTLSDMQADLRGNLAQD